MATLWLVVNNGTGVVYHANPLDAAAIGELVQRYRATVLIATPTFLQLYARRCTPGQFGSLRLVIAGAEKLPPALAQLFEDTFGLPVYEGYGATECAPAVALNAPDFRGPGYYQPGSRRGTVGQPLPGVSARIVDPESGERLPPGERGLILIRGPNLMAGYLGRDDLTAGALRDGWYVTGDIAKIDEDGFVRITDRLSRFSKIAGEMVPHIRVEEVVSEALVDFPCAVTAIPDERKGEQLVVFHTATDVSAEELWKRLASSELPKLWIPRRENLRYIEAIPTLGSGKLDLKKLRELARGQKTCLAAG
jgi:acyl-[acyl-carrier-protein]-phospholipid O-acyltransferase/long-chain-fatty-acid--[acyl-carrier-protein] ligase